MLYWLIAYAAVLVIASFGLWQAMQVNERTVALQSEMTRLLVVLADEVEEALEVAAAADRRSFNVSERLQQELRERQSEDQAVRELVASQGRRLKDHIANTSE